MRQAALRAVAALFATITGVAFLVGAKTGPATDRVQAALASPDRSPLRAGGLPALPAAGAPPAPTPGSPPPSAVTAAGPAGSNLTPPTPASPPGTQAGTPPTSAGTTPTTTPGTTPTTRPVSPSPSPSPTATTTRPGSPPTTRPTTTAPTPTTTTVAPVPASPSPPTSASTTTTTAAPIAPSTIAGLVIKTTYGNVQVQLTLQGHQILAATALQLPSSSSRSQQINSRAAPILSQEVLTAQSAQIDTVTGATTTSAAYARSVQAILNQAWN